ncbi:MAG: hypothetical protein ACRDQA_17225 [Nocardioidaceae bacterium]
MPLFTDAVRPTRFDLRLEQCDETPSLLDSSEFDGAETSFSRYVLARGRGDDRLVGVPAFVMRSFRHRCLLVRRDSDIEDLVQLKGARIGLTGWPDSGNTWTRAVLRRAGVNLDDVQWHLGRVSDGDQPKQRNQAALPHNVEVVRTGQSLLELLGTRSLDAIMSPFTPAELPSSGFRHLLPDLAASERKYFDEVGYVPGIHVIALRQELASTYPWLPAALLEVLEESKHVWLAERRRYADTTPWQLQDILRTEEVFGADWMPYGLGPNEPMVADFCQELHEQGISPQRIDPVTVFSSYETHSDGEDASVS